MTPSPDEIRFMRRALSLGRFGRGSTFPNPPVGAVLVKDNRIIGEGWHRRKGEAHAEALAIADARERGFDLRGASMFVTLEPCCHHGATPPCTTAIIDAGIARVFISCVDDFDSRVCGGGIFALRAAGVEVVEGLLPEEGAELIEQYRIQRTEGRAFLSAKWAQSLDGSIATSAGDSQWISGRTALKFAHRLRAEHCAVAVGANTALIDNPRLSVREVRSHNSPARIVLAGERELPASLALLSGETRTIVVHDGGNSPVITPSPKIELIEIPRWPNFWGDFLKKIFELGIGSVLLEGGGEVITSALAAGAVDRVFVVIAPLFIGGGIPAVGGLGVERLEDSIKLERARYRKLGVDLILSGYPKKG